MHTNNTCTAHQSTLAFFTAEANRIHELCDQANVPREADGMAFTMAQRVEILAGVYAGLVVKVIGTGSPDRLH